MSTKNTNTSDDENDIKYEGYLSYQHFQFTDDDTPSSPAQSLLCKRSVGPLTQPNPAIPFLQTKLTLTTKFISFASTSFKLSSISRIVNKSGLLTLFFSDPTSEDSILYIKSETIEINTLAYHLSVLLTRKFSKKQPKILHSRRRTTFTKGVKRGQSLFDNFDTFEDTRDRTFSRLNSWSEEAEHIHQDHPSSPVSDEGLGFSYFDHPEIQRVRTREFNKEFPSLQSQREDDFETLDSLPLLEPAVGLNFGRCGKQGYRTNMEDCDISKEGLQVKDEVFDYHAIFDGHCGRKAAEFAQENLLNYILAEFEKCVGILDVKQAVKMAFQRLDRAFLEVAQKERYIDGSCAILILVNKTSMELYSVCLGDSKCVLVTRTKTEDLSFDHSALSDNEKQRIERIGGWVTVEEDLVVDKRHEREPKFTRIGRVNGELAVARAIGDIDLKSPWHNEYKFWLLPPEKRGIGTLFDGEDLVSAVPEVRYKDLSGLTEDVYIVLACDGLFETLEIEEIGPFVYESKDELNILAEKLVDLSLQRGSTDNVTCVVVKAL
eukprot:snap_masked-scaffold_40-processed-gene-1.26-mRNA-1 protein AED:1.00 eAED:1.00 QI:0/-1/0/0/-1/1/1/0/546